MKYNGIGCLIMASMVSFSCTTKPAQESTGSQKFTGASGEVKLITLAPGHFHAALVQKSAYDQVSNDVFVYAPKGAELDAHLKLVNGFNTRATTPTHWKEHIYTGPDFLQKMIQEKKGNVMVTAGNNRNKTKYIEETLKAGINVLADKPMVINTQNFERLKECFRIAEEKGLFLYDIMTERYEITSMLQGFLSQQKAIYGEQLKGSPEDPAIIEESVHHFFKLVDNKPLVRPAWFFDVEQEGEGIVDVTTHLVDLIQYETFPGVTLDYTKDYEVLDATRGYTALEKKQFCEVTGLDDYPAYLTKYLNGDVLQVYSNGDITYKIKGVTAKVSVTWKYAFPKGGGDTHFAIMKGSKASLIIRQGKEENFKPELYIQTTDEVEQGAYEKALQSVADQVAANYPGVVFTKEKKGLWHVEIPATYRDGHEAHFGKVTQHFLRYLKEGALPAWEVPNMIAKYYVTTRALEIAKQKK